MSFAGTVFGLPLARELRGKCRHGNSGFHPLVFSSVRTLTGLGLGELMEYIDRCLGNPSARLISLNK